ncbi:hypothetical protein DACRYDRAFT_105640, partial [Dacryopinax primogenitus]
AKPSEIDDIFSGKAAISKASQPPVLPSGTSTSKPARLAAASSPANGLKKKKKQKKAEEAKAGSEQASKDVVTDTTPNPEPKPLKRPAETIVDPSLPRLSKKPKFSSNPLTNASLTTKSKPRKKPELDEEERAFRDSRGNEPRRKTEEGWNVYKEDELGIGKEGGGGYTALPI